MSRPTLGPRSPAAGSVSPLEILIRIHGGVPAVADASGVHYRALYRFLRGTHHTAPMNIIEQIAPVLRRSPAWVRREWNALKRARDKIKTKKIPGKAFWRVN